MTRFETHWFYFFCSFILCSNLIEMDSSQLSLWLFMVKNTKNAAFLWRPGLRKHCMRWKSYLKTITRFLKNFFIFYMFLAQVDGHIINGKKMRKLRNTIEFVLFTEMPQSFCYFKSTPGQPPEREEKGTASPYDCSNNISNQERRGWFTIKLLEMGLAKGIWPHLEI